MYETFFGLTRRPFTAAPQVDAYVPSQYSEAALANLSRAIGRGEGPALVIGGTGTGKTLVLHKLADTFAKNFRIAYLATARFSSPTGLLQNILYELGRPYRGMQESELRLALTEYLLENDTDSRPLLLLVDEAHTLSLRLLEEFRMVTNLVRGGQPLVRLVLAGNARLEERFTSPKLDSLNQRIAARCYLESLNREETANYVQGQLVRAGGQPEQLLADDAYGAIYTATDGVPRLINQVCDQALLLAAVAEHFPLDAACVEEAWADLQQLPTPWNREPMTRPAPATESAGVIEFGTLGDHDSPPVVEQETAQEQITHENLEPTAPAAEVTPTVEASPEVGTEHDPVFSYDIYHTGEPTMELEQLQQSLSQLSEEVSQATMSGSQPPLEMEESKYTTHTDEEDFEPAGFVGPEVELVFHGPHHPFGETFAEEEVVIDHYASLDKSVAPQRVHDQSGQSKEIAAMLDELPEETKPEAMSQKPSLAIVADEEDTTLDTSEEPSMAVRPQSTELTTLAAGWDAAAADPVLPEPSHEDSYDEGLFEATDDRDIIIIEEQRGAGTAVASKPASRVRRQEYRQLFARLRRGG